MNKLLALRGARILVALLVFVAIVAQIAKLHSLGTFNPSNFFSFFTIESNILAAAVLVYIVATDKRHDTLRGAATLFMVITGIIYTLLLAGTDVQTPLPWVNAVLHYIFPVYMLIDWFADAPERAVALKRAALWLIFPVVYAVYSLVRGSIVHWYPYPFLNVDKLGYSTVFVNCLFVALFGVALAYGISVLPKLRHHG